MKSVYWMLIRYPFNNFFYVNITTENDNVAVEICISFSKILLW